MQFLGVVLAHMRHTPSHRAERRRVGISRTLGVEWRTLRSPTSSLRDTRLGSVCKRSIVSGYFETNSTKVAASGLTWPPCSHFSTVRGLTRSMLAHTERETLNFSRTATKNSAPGDSLISAAGTLCVRRVSLASRCSFIAPTPSISSAKRFRLPAFCLVISCPCLFAQRVLFPVPAAVDLSCLSSNRLPRLCRTTSATRFLHPTESSSR